VRANNKIHDSRMDPPILYKNSMKSHVYGIYVHGVLPGSHVAMLSSSWSTLGFDAVSDLIRYLPAQ